MLRRLARLAFLSICALLPIRVARAQLPYKQGVEFQVNSYTTNLQSYPRVGVGGDDSFVIAWSSQSQDGEPTGYGVFARRYSSAGVAQAVEFQVNSYTTNLQERPAVAVGSSGDFMIVWNSFAQDGSQYGVFGRRFSSSAAALAVEFQVASRTAYYQNAPAIGAQAGGDFVVTWQSYMQDGSQFGIFARRFDSSGLPQGVEFQVNGYTTLSQRRPAIAIAGNGSFVVAWEASGGHDGNGYGVFARRFDSAGVTQGPEFQVNTYTIGNQARPAVAAGGNGDFVVAWQTFGQDGDDDGIFARRFTSSGAAQAVEFRVNTFTLNYQRQPAASGNADGRFVITWHSNSGDGFQTGVFARSFDSSGVAQAPEFQVNSFTPGVQSVPAVAFGASNNFIVTWHDNSRDGGVLGVFAQRFLIPPFANIDVDGDGVIGPLTDGLLILRFAFGFTGPVLIGNAVAGACTRCTAPDIESYLTSLGLIIDVDGNGAVEPLTDALIILRLLFGFSDPVLTANAIGVGCTRCDHPSISAYLNSIDG